MSDSNDVMILSQLQNLVNDVAKLRRCLRRLENDRTVKPVRYYLNIYRNNEDNLQRVMNSRFLIRMFKAQKKEINIKEVKTQLEARALQFLNFNYEDLLKMPRVNFSPARSADIKMLQNLKQTLEDSQTLRRRIRQLSNDPSVRPIEYYCQIYAVNQEAFEDRELELGLITTVDTTLEIKRLKDQLAVCVAAILHFNYDGIFGSFGIL